MRASCKGDRDAFGELVRMHQGRVFNLALRLLADREEAEDAAQEAFLRAYTGLKGWKGKGPLAAWLYRITLNVCRDLARRRARRAGIFLSLSEETGGEGAWEAGTGDRGAAILPGVESLEREEVRRYVREALALLPEHYRSALVLFELEGLSYEEIAEMTGAPVGTVRSRLNRARLMFKEHIRKWVKLE